MNELIAIITITSTIIFAVTSIYGKIIIEELENSYYFFLLQILFILPILFFINLILKPNLTYLTSVSDLLIAFFASIFAFIGYIFLYKGFEVGNVSVGGVMLSSRVLVSIPLAILIGELYPFLTYVFIFIALIGAILVSYKKGLTLKDFFQFKSSGMNYFIVTLFAWAISNTLTRELNNHFEPLLFLFIRIFMFFIIAIITYPYLRSKLTNNQPMYFSKKHIYQVLTYVLILITAQMLYVYALGLSLTITEGLGVLEGIFTFILAISLSKIVYFKNYLQEPLERLTLTVRTFGVLITTIGTFGVLYILQTL